MCKCLYPLEILACIQSLPDDSSLMSVAFLWCWWQERNNINHQERRLSESEFSSMIHHHVEEWKLSSKKVQQPGCESKICWQPPPVDFVKINIGGTDWMHRLEAGGLSQLARDSAGDPIFAAAGKVNVASEALQTELMALVNVIPIAEGQGIGRIIFSRRKL